MSNYTTFAVNWSGKDALSDSDPAKVISGGDFHNEFTAVQTAVNTKADLNGSASEAFSATTATASTNTTQVATTEFVQTKVSSYSTTTEMNTAIDTDVATHAGLRSSSSTFGHAKIWVSGTTLNITTS
jgi:hypothetical protein